MPLPMRMARNSYLLKERIPDKLIRPVVFYVGREPLRLSCPLITEFGEFRYELIDARDLDGEALLRAQDLRDNMLAILTTEDKGRVIKRVVDGLAAMEGRARADRALQFVILGGLRGLERAIMEGVHTMVTIADLLANEVLGPVLSEQFARGREQGQQQGREEGREEGERSLLRAQLEKRFGPLPAAAQQRLEGATERELTQWALSILSARDLNELFGADYLPSA